MWFNYRDIDDRRESLYGSIKSNRKHSKSYTFCVHGNKYGLSKCSNDQHREHNDELLSNIHDIETSDISHARNSTRSSGSKYGGTAMKIGGTHCWKNHHYYEIQYNSTWIGLDHCHIERESGIDKKARRKLVIASILCLIFMVVEVVGGILANSLAIATDAAHLLTDLASFMVSLFSIWLASRPSTQKMSFGWHRAEVSSNN